MSPTRLLIAAAAVLALGGALYFVLSDGSSGEPGAAAPGAATGPQAASPAALTVEALTSAPEAEAPVLAGAATEAARVEALDAEVFASQSTWSCDLELQLPGGAALGGPWQVLAVPADELGDLDADEVLGEWRAGRLGEPPTWTLASTREALELPEDWGALDLWITDPFLMQSERLRIEPGEPTAVLRARDAARLVVQLSAPADRPLDGSVQLRGQDFGGRGVRAQERSVNVRTAEAIVFEQLDPRLTWTATPEFAGLHGFSESGIELRPRAESSTALELTVGAAVTGRVLDERGAPVQGATVEVAGGGGWWSRGRSNEVETDAQGRFALLAIAPGDVQVEATLRGKLSAESETFELAVGERAEGVELVLGDGRSIAGVVLSPDGTPRAGATVYARTQVTPSGWAGFGGPRSVTTGSTVTDEAGRFEITGLESGSFSVHASAVDPEASTEDQAITLRAVAKAVEAGSDGTRLQLQSPIGLVGRVVDDRGEPVDAFKIEARRVDVSETPQSENFTDEEGRFLFERIAEGSWSLLARADGYVTSEDWAVELPGQAGVEHEFVLTRQASVSGVVLDSTGAPIAEARVSAEDGSSSGSGWGRPRGERTTTDAEGRFVLAGLKPGGQLITAAAEGFADSEAWQVQLEPGQLMDQAALSLRTGGTIRGKVVTPEGDPVSGRRVTWGRDASPFGVRGAVNTDAAGEFIFEHVTPGDWTVAASPSMAEMSRNMRGRNDQSAFIEALADLDLEDVTVVDGEVTEVFIGGEPKRLVRIVGEVSREGEPFEGAQVYAVSEGSAVFEGMKTARVAADGSFELTVDRPGPYVLSASRDRVGVERLIDVPRVDEVRFDLEVPVGGIEGRVLRPDGSAAEGIRLSISREDGLGRMRWDGSSASTDAEGRYRFSDLEPGQYTVRANTSSWGGGRRGADRTVGSVVRSGIAVDEDGLTSGIDFELQTAGTLEGRVTTSTGDPAVGVSVYFRDESGQIISTVSGTRTDASGSFTKEGLAPGTYTVSARSETLAASEAASATVRSGETAQVNFQVEESTTLVVALKDEQDETVRALFQVFDEDGLDVSGLVTLESIQAAFTGGTSSRERRIGPLPPGRYEVRGTTLDGRSADRKVTLRGKGGDKTVNLRLRD